MIASSPAPVRENDALRWIMPMWIALCVILGGASAGGLLANLALQVVAAAVIAWTMWSGAFRPLARSERALWWLVGLTMLWISISLIPLPPSIWAALPRRGSVAEGYALMDMSLPWLSISLAGDRTIRSVLWLLVPIATYLLARQTGARATRWTLTIVTTLAIGSLMLGLAQMIGGSESPLRPYAITNRSKPVGLFSNSNHFATLMVVALPLAAAWFRQARDERASQVVPVILFAMLAIVIAAALFLNGSIAGLGLFVPAVLGGCAIVLGWPRNVSGRSALVGIALIGITGAVAVAVNLGAIDTKFDELPTSRAVITPVTMTAAIDHLPVGTGLGSFAQIYASREPPELVSRRWVNHAHNDVAEILLELGLPGAIAMLWLLVHVIGMTWRAWGTAQAPLARGASLALLLILTHSLVDYPLRTHAIAALFALCLALAASPRAPSTERNP